MTGLFLCVTACSGQLRTPAMVIGGALVVGGATFTAQSESRQCDGGDFNCAGEAISGTVLGMIIAGVGASLLLGAAVGNDPDNLDYAQQGTPAPAPVVETPATVEPSSPPPALEPEPAQW
ncbi:MAG TPA: hypothetical protein VK427_19885 [Kofleriaceae bacterium]|nr:hypothetical protein [Kofleriaceae bacterium]